MKGFDRWIVLPAIFIIAFTVLVESSKAGPIQPSDSHIDRKDSSLGQLMAFEVDFGMDSSQPNTAAYLSQSAATCTDSDGGINYEVAGYVQGIGHSGWSYTYYDTCQTGTYEGYLKETYCNGTLWWAKRYKCPDGCANGACVSASCTDADADGYAVEGGDCGAVDCNDSNASIHPGATEVCDNGLDDDCNGLVDAADPACLVCTDADGDDYAVEGGDCGLIDCNDSNASIHPGATEVCNNGLDDDCDGDIDADDSDCDTSFKNIIVIGWDATQRNHFWECYNKQLSDCPNGLPNIQALSGGAIFNSTITDGETSTKPGWTQIFTGYNAKVTGVYTNWQYKPIPDGYTVFEKVENYFGSSNVVTMFVSGKAEHTGGACVGEPTYKNGQLVIEDLGQPWCFTKTHLDYFETNLQANSNVGNRALALLAAHQDDRIFALFMFWDPDVHGHMSGENSAYYSKQIVDDDSWLGKIVAKLRELGIYEQTLVYVVTDHGFDEGGNQHTNAPYGFLASNDPLIMRSGDRKDVAPTILERYGITRGAIGAAPAVNGYSLYSIAPLTCIPAGGAYLDYPGAPACCSGLQRISLDKKMGSSCLIATGGTGDNSGYCTACGNGVCEAPENKCNCAADCRY